MEEQIIEHMMHLYLNDGQTFDKNKIKDCIEKFSMEYNVPVMDIYDAVNTNLNKFADSPDFIDEPYNIKTDDQEKNKVPHAQQEYLSRDFTRYGASRFPVFDNNSQIPKKFGKKPYWTVQKSIRESLITLKDQNWSNQTLSYARINTIGKHIVECIIHPLFKKGIFDKNNFVIVDATGNIGTDSITFAMEYFVSHVKTYEILPHVYNMLVKNIDLYGYNDKITALNKRFDYDIPKRSLVIIDPPYETGNNADNFNLSIDKMPIYYVAQEVLNAGAAVVLLSMPKKYRYNAKFAQDFNHHVSVYQMGKVNNKMFLIMKHEDAFKAGLKDWNHTLVTTDETKKIWNGKKIDYNRCKTVSSL